MTLSINSLSNDWLYMMDKTQWCVFRVCVCSEVANLAKAAVAGDESALDMFVWRKGSSKLNTAPASEYAFFYGTTGGKIDAIYIYILATSINLLIGVD